MRRPTTITYRDGRVRVLCYVYIDIYIDNPPQFERRRQRFRRAWEGLLNDQPKTNLHSSTSPLVSDS